MAPSVACSLEDEAPTVAADRYLRSFRRYFSKTLAGTSDEVDAGGSRLKSSPHVRVKKSRCLPTTTISVNSFYVAREIFSNHDWLEPFDGLFSTAGRLDDKELMTATLSCFIFSVSIPSALVFLLTERLAGLSPPFSSRRSILTGPGTDPLDQG